MTAVHRLHGTTPRRLAQVARSRVHEGRFGRAVRKPPAAPQDTANQLLPLAESSSRLQVHIGLLRTASSPFASVEPTWARTLREASGHDGTCGVPDLIQSALG